MLQDFIDILCGGSTVCQKADDDDDDFAKEADTKTDVLCEGYLDEISLNI